ncbi:S8 family serine peptidase [Hymenobacter arizonensis]|uniref:Serine protease, subtilisin family n=1 Tax=Hymenobacter arizonensis TaxID=1227077 RepID=A0A1I5X8R8_HYMAR|nr:S8 family serine peptidase [Hymenobacter arizonensis]SFQ28358.1 Serine protease, subtilisin family [Hymenobacter arizonensis]
MQKHFPNIRLASWLLSGSLLASTSVFMGCSNDTVAPTSSVDTAAATADARPDDVIPGQYIVVLKDGAVATSPTDNYEDKVRKVRASAQGLLRGRGLRAEAVGVAYGHVLKGFAAKLTPQEAAELAKDEQVSYVEADRMISLGKPVKGPKEPAPEPTPTPTPTPSPTPSTQTVPYGITRVGYGDGTGKTAWVIDSGIDLNHPDLNVDVTRSRSFLSSSTSAEDGNGHGTHVAGTIAAINNTYGVVGVAANATVVAVRVLDAAGSGSTSGVIAGVDYVGANGRVGDVANMSLGGGASQALDDAVLNASNKGILFALAAGNNSGNAALNSPARVNGANIFTISAMDINDSWASFSNFGNPPIDYCMPGVSIRSTWIGDGYNTISGTSMATPHMAGALLLRGKSFTLSGSVKNDPDGVVDRIAHL